MKELEKYLNQCYLEFDDSILSVYKFAKVNNKYGFLFYEIQIEPEDVYIYEDFPTNQELEINFIKSFIPELDTTCKAKNISEGHYYELTSRIQKLYDEQIALHTKIKKFINNPYGLDEEI